MVSTMGVVRDPGTGGEHERLRGGERERLPDSPTAASSAKTSKSASGSDHSSLEDTAEGVVRGWD